MVNIDSIKARIDWLKDGVKMLLSICVVAGAGVSGLYFENKSSLLFYIGLLFIISSSIFVVYLLFKIDKLIKELENY